MKTHPEHADVLLVNQGSLGRLREAVDRLGRRYGLARRAVQELVLIANELATNVVRHGGGTGRMWLWCQDSTVYCQVADRGGGMAHPERAGTMPVEPGALAGRGLWIIRQLCDRLHIASGPGGTTITVCVALAR
jgi:anti-sigma regulatory factor (Ser/Thr protein kinase)